MSSEVESTKHDDENLSCGLLLRDIEEISKALYLHKSPSKPSDSSPDHCPDVAAKTALSKSKSCVIIQDSSNKDKKSSLWKWRPLKALAHIRNHRFNCCFFLHVHVIEDLPPNFEHLDLSVNWKRKNDMSRTRPARVSLGMAEFEETLMHKCTIYGTRNGPHAVKFEPKIFLLCASVIEAPKLDIGNHWIDLSKLLPLTLDELEGYKNSTGKWTTSFKLTGEAKGALLNVSFGFSILEGNSFEPGYFVKVPDIVKEGGLNQFADFDNLCSVARISTEGSYRHSQSANVNFLEEILPKQELELSHSVTLLYRKLDESAGGKTGHEFIDADFDVIDQIKSEKCSQRFDSTVIETIDVAEIFDGEDCAFDDTENEDNSKFSTEPSFEELGSAFDDMLKLKPFGNSLLDMINNREQENYMKSSSTKLLSLDDASESIENEFLNMLSVDQGQDDIVSVSGSIFDVDDYDLSLSVQEVEKNHSSVDQSLRSRRNAKLLENLETEALMHEWGINENAFQYSPQANSGGFGSPVYVPREEPLKLPSIEEGLGPILRTKDGGYLRSMNPLLFANANNGARLIVQVSAPVVLSPAMGLTIMEILQRWASEGVEKMCIQLNEIMPLEDVTGKTMRQVLSEAESGSNDSTRWALQKETDVSDESFVEKKPTGHPPFAPSFEDVCSSNSEQIESDYVSFDDLIPLTITNIEGLLVQGLKIQSGMPDQESLSSMRIKSCNDVDELIKYTLPLEEWLRLDSGEFSVQEETDENTLKLFGKNFKMGLKVQLRDPLRNYETVGSSMLALIQVDMIYSSEKVCKDGMNEHTILEGHDFERNEKKFCRPLFKVSEVYLAGLNVTHGNNKQLCASSRQQQSGSRWLFSSGMTKSSKNTVSNSKAILKLSNGLMRKSWHSDILWSISLPNRGEAGTWDELVALNVHVRNPDIIFPTESVK